METDVIKIAQKCLYTNKYYEKLYNTMLCKKPNTMFPRIEVHLPFAGCQLDFVKKKVFLKGLIFQKKGFCNKKKGFPCQMDSFLIPAKGFFTSCILK